jgi:hypothetical protein
VDSENFHRIGSFLQDAREGEAPAEPRSAHGAGSTTIWIAITDLGIPQLPQAAQFALR